MADPVYQYAKILHTTHTKREQFETRTAVQTLDVAPIPLDLVALSPFSQYPTRQRDT
ncbi:LOW QUALITY PROTEIN: uncharacterized protein ACLA_091140 [Aspergillus clavatus NRRL 1]|uniref:Uncharacterized protein n=1 Tax=Aspergillus clavatus (strain ATCC 1007 / CBS 513.65 / DSM 816 / NCTC 3887 / NRRL 1 / QM 1276 / 107) TaxID=344612 RepID=A1CEW7_ASPCL|nr:LOW QUALITY PROTEIN: uncharacterized protein ACLA_091140 [Aspergillus clavatus NRRL 1]EAW11416.1 hypothetical protein ACLA_091140 [Aspergillus clavatus NRRL 1]